MDKQFIFLKGEGEGNTRVVWDSSDSIATCATFSVHADNTVVTGITFEVTNEDEICVFHLIFFS